MIGSSQDLNMKHMEVDYSRIIAETGMVMKKASGDDSSLR
jgi:hypothetical protein